MSNNKLNSTIINDASEANNVETSLSITSGETSNVTYDYPSDYYLKHNVFTENVCGQKHVQRINLRTGKWYAKQYIHGVSGKRLPFNLTLTYNPTYANTTNVFLQEGETESVYKLPFKGWKFNYQQFVKKNDGKYYYYDANFELHVFTPAQNTTDTYYDCTGQTALLLKEVIDENGNVTSVEITDDKTLTYAFTAIGLLYKITEKKGSQASETTITYDSSNNIVQIVDGAGRVVLFTYNVTAKTIEVAQRLSDGTDNTMAVATYNESNQLMQVSYPQELHYVAYEYDAQSYLLKKITNDSENERTDLTFNENGNLTQLLNYKYDNGGHVLKDEIQIIIDTENFKKTRIKNIMHLTDGVETEKVKFYYFAENGELIYSLLDDDTLGNTNLTMEGQAKMFLDNTSFVSVKDFEYYGTILSQNPMINFKQEIDNEEVSYLEINAKSTIESTVLNLPKISNRSQYCLFAVKLSNRTNSTNAVVKLKEGETIKQTVIFTPDTHFIQYVLMKIDPQEHNYVLEVTNSSNLLLGIKAGFFNFTQPEEFKCVTAPTEATSSIIEKTSGSDINWNKFNQCHIYKGSRALAMNVDFTYSDYCLTKLSYLKNPESFTVWYNDGKNVICNCSSENLKFRFDGNSSVLFTEFDYAKAYLTACDSVFEKLAIENNQLKIIKNSIINNNVKSAYSLINSYYQITETRDENDTTNRYTYDAYGNCTQQETQRSTIKVSRTASYSNGDQLASQTEYRETTFLTTYYTYDDYGRLKTVKTPNGQVITYDNRFEDTYETMQTSLTKSDGTTENIANRTSYINQRLNSFDTYGLDIEFAYDKLDNVKMAFLHTKALLYNVNTVYNADKSGYIERTFSSSDEAERRYFDIYGHINRITEVINGVETDKYLLIYSDEPIVGNIVQDLSDSRIKLSQNSLLRQIVDKGSSFNYNYFYSYDLTGKLTSIQCSGAQTEYERDESDRISKIFVNSLNIAKSIERTFNYRETSGNEIASESAEFSMNTSSSTITTTYNKDNFNRPLSVTVVDENNNGYKEEYTYYRKHKYVLPTQFEGSYTFGYNDNLGNFVQSDILVNDGYTNFLGGAKRYKIESGIATLEKQEGVKYDLNNNITEYGNNSYVYDKINRLIRENNYSLGKTFVYNYDKHGNITSRVEYSYTTATNLSTLTPTKTDTFSYYTSGWQDQLKKVNNGTQIVYDYQGKPTSYNGKTFEWNTDKLVKITSGSNVYSYTYDCLGNVVYKENEANNSFRSYVYANGKLTHEHLAEPNCFFNLNYVYNEKGVAGITAHNYSNNHANEILYTFRKNVFGDITEIYQGTTCVAKYKYDAWGNCTVCNPDGTVNTNEDFIGNLNPFRYRGYYWDKHAEMYYLQTRWYDATVCRFISPDSYEYLDPTTFGGLNLYAYCLNNPVNYKQRPVSSGCSVTSSSISVGGSTGIGGSLGASDSVSNGSAPWYAQTIVGALPDLYSGARYLMAKGMHKYFAYKKNYYYMFPISGGTHKRLAIHSTSFGKLSNATFRELVTGNAKASIGSVIGNIAGVGVFTFGTNLLFNLHENGFDLTDKAMWIDTGIDTAIGMGAYGLAMGTASLATAGLAMAGVALPGIVVIGGVIILSIGFDNLIRAISGYWE